MEQVSFGLRSFGTYYFAHLVQLAVLVLDLLQDSFVHALHAGLFLVVVVSVVWHRGIFIGLCCHIC